MTKTDKNQKKFIPIELYRESAKKAFNESVNIYADAVNKSAKLLNSEIASIYMLSDDNKRFDIFASKGIRQKSSLPESMQINDPFVKYFLNLKTSKGIRAGEEKIENNYFRLPLIIAPIIVDTDIKGVLFLSGKADGSDYNGDDLEIAGLIVSQLASSLTSMKSKVMLNEAEEELKELKKKYLTLYDRSSMSYLWLNSKGDIIDANKPALKMLGYTLKELKCMKVREIVKDIPFDYKKIKNIRKTYDDLALKRKNDTYIDVQVNVSKLTFGADPFYIVSIREISDKKVLERQIIEGQYKFLTMIDGIKDGIILVDNKLEVLAINKEQSRRCGISPKKAIGKPCHEIFKETKEECLATTECSIKNAIKKKSVCRDLFKHLNKDGDEEFTEISAFPLFDDAGKVAQVIAVIRDVTMEKKLHHQLIYSEKLATLGTLSAKIGHEIRNPLTAILTCAQFLAMKDKENKSIKIIISEGSRIKGMVNDLLTLSRPKEPVESLVFVEKVIEEVIDFLMNVTGQIKYHNIKKKFSDIPPIKGDEGQLTQLFTNLILNASQAMEEADRRESDLIIGTKFSDDQKYSITFVTDRGNGIKKEDVKKIFDPFFTTKGEKGTGLGMLVVKEIVDSHNGKIEIESKIGTGTTVSVYLPIADELS